MGRSEGESHQSVKSGSTMAWLILIIVILLKWNVRSLLSNGQEFKYFIKEMTDKPDVICDQEACLKPTLGFVVHRCTVVRSDRNQGGGGGCATFAKQGIPYRVLGKGDEQEWWDCGREGRRWLL